MIEVKDIVKNYGNHKAVDHLSFRLEKGRIYGFLGPNGAGKSTTMNIMTGYIAANEGTVTIDGHDILKEPEEAKKKIGYLPEIPPLYSDMTVDEFLNFVADLKKVPKKEKRDQIEKILKMTMLGDYGKRMIRNLSKGYKQRVGLAQALVGFPEVIILDEPTVGLDPQQIIEIRNLIKELKDDHVVILSSHILSEVNAVCDHVLIISHGKLAAEGTPEELEMRFQGQEHIKMSILGTEAKIKGALAGIDGISNVTFGEDTDSQGGVRVDVINDGKEDIRADIARALAGLGLPVLSMELEKKTLEDIFLEVTTSTPGSDEKPKRMMRLAKDVEKEAMEESVEEAERAGFEENTEDQVLENPEDDEK
ncbi:MAG: ABC transporter ATP-binding protein [Butyrivibrio sp.]|nr:ABC transporter ATP-binding protein [Butyrivibrio sp.]